MVFFFFLLIVSFPAHPCSALSLFAEPEGCSAQTEVPWLVSAARNFLSTGIKLPPRSLPEPSQGSRSRRTGASSGATSCPSLAGSPRECPLQEFLTRQMSFSSAEARALRPGLCFTARKRGCKAGPRLRRYGSSATREGLQLSPAPRTTAVMAQGYASLC